MFNKGVPKVARNTTLKTQVKVPLDHLKSVIDLMHVKSLPKAMSKDYHYKELTILLIFLFAQDLKHLKSVYI